MIFLPLTTDKIQLITSSAATIDVQANFIEAVKATGVTYDIGKQNTAISSAATTDILGVPGANNARTLKQMTARNKDASLSDDVTVQYNANSTLYEMYKTTLYPGDTLEYIEGVGFFVLSVGWRAKTLYVTADSVHATAATFADITGLSLALLSGRLYAFEAHLFHISNATTTGAQFAVNISGGAPTTLVVGNHSGVTNAVVTGIISLGTATALDTAMSAQTTGSANITHTIVAGFIQPSADGTFAMRATSEVTVANGVTVKKGSWLTIRATDN